MEKDGILYAPEKWIYKVLFAGTLLFGLLSFVCINQGDDVKLCALFLFFTVGSAFCSFYTWRIRNDYLLVNSQGIEAQFSTLRKRKQVKYKWSECTCVIEWSWKYLGSSLSVKDKDGTILEQYNGYEAWSTETNAMIDDIKESLKRYSSLKAHSEA